MCSGPLSRKVSDLGRWPEARQPGGELARRAVMARAHAGGYHQDPGGIARANWRLVGPCACARPASVVPEVLAS
jgi:hypothetical protein